MNINMLMQQAKKMQNDMEKAKEEVSKKTFTAKQPLVEVEVNGDTEITKISISKDIEKEDIEVLEDMILIKKILTIDIGYESLVKIFF